MNWYYEANGQSQGPVPEAEIARLLAAGTITKATLVWREGLTAWTPLGEAFPGGEPSAGTAPTGGPAPAAAATPGGEAAPEGWIRCTATGRFFPPNEIVYIAGKPYSLEAKNSVVQGVIQTGTVPSDFGAERNGPPWEQRDQLGLVAAAWATVKGALISPGETFATMKREGGIGAPLLFLIIVGTIGGVIGILYQLLIQGGIQQMAGANGANAPFGFAMTTTIWIVFAVALPVILAIGSFITVGIIHLCLMIIGGAKQPFEVTYRTYCYSNGAAALLQVIPFCGAYITGIWGLVSLIIGISKTHEISIGRAVLAVLLPFVLCCGIALVVGIAVGVGGSLAAPR